MLHTITYCSESTIESASLAATLKQLETTAQAANQTRNISGVLFYHNGIFLQTIEGPEDALIGLMQQITADSRHRNIIILSNKSLTQRNFPQWHMTAFDISEPQRINKTQRKTLKLIFEDDFPIHDPLLMRFYSVVS